MKQSVQHNPSNSNTEVGETSNYEERLSYQLPRDVSVGAYNRDELISLLAYFEGELQARDIALSVLRSEQKAANEKNGHLLKSLQSDLSNLNVVDNSEVYVQLYPNQFRHLNSLVDAQKEYQVKFAEKLLETEDRHARQLFELRDKLEQTEKSIDKTKQGVCSVLEERIESLKNECARKQQELDRLDLELRNREKDTEEEKERQKTIILFMLSERKHLLSLIHQMTLKMKDNPAGEHGISSSNIIEELKKQLRIVCEERNGFSRQCNNLQAEKTNLLNIVHSLEENIISLKTSTFINKPTEIDVRGHVFANNAVIELPSQMTELNNTGTVRFNKWPKDQKGLSSFPTKSFESNFQNTNMINGNVSQRTYINDGSNLPRPSSTTSRPQHPAMGVRGSQIRNSRPAMGISAQSEDHHIIHPQSNFHTSQFPTTASDMSPTYVQSPRSQIRMIPIHEQSTSSSNIVLIPHSSNSDNRISKRSTSLPRKMSNGDIIVTPKSPNQPSSPSKIRPPTQNHTAAPPNFQPPIPQRGHHKHGHTHIS